MSQKLFLLFSIGRDRYALAASDVAVVLPLPQFKQVPGAPAWVAGLFSYGGSNVPVLDMSRLATGQAAASRLSTRLVLVRYAVPGMGERLLGLVLEKTTDTLRCDDQAFEASPLDHGQARYLGPVMQHGQDLLQWITVDSLLDAPTRALLFPLDEVAS